MRLVNPLQIIKCPECQHWSLAPFFTEHNFWNIWVKMMQAAYRPIYISALLS